MRAGATVDVWSLAFQLVSIPLLNAAESGHFEDVKLLLEHGADISQRNYYGLTGESQNPS